MTLPRYLIATDLSRASRRAAAAAAELAPGGKALLDFVCVVAPTPPGTPNDVKTAVLTSLDRLAASYTRAGFETSSHALAAKDTSAALTRHALRTGADYIVAAPQGVTNWKKVAMGGTTERLLKRAPMSLLVARRPSGVKPRILVGVDQSPGAARALHAAATLAQSIGAPIDVVEVIAAPSMAIHVEEAFVGVSSHEVKRERMRLAKRGLKEWLDAQTLPAGVQVKPHAVVGSPAQALVDEAKEREASLIVVAAQSASRAKSVFVGSVSRAVAASAAVSVLVVRSRSRAK